MKIKLLANSMNDTNKNNQSKTSKLDAIRRCEIIRLHSLAYSKIKVIKDSTNHFQTQLVTLSFSRCFPLSLLQFYSLLKEWLCSVAFCQCCFRVDCEDRFCCRQKTGTEYNITTNTFKSFSCEFKQTYTL